MKKRLIYSMFLLFALFSAGVLITIAFIYRTTNDLKSIIGLHRIEIIRQQLVINAQTVQGHLYTIGTDFGKELDTIVDNVIDLDDSVKGCTECHHNEKMTERLLDLDSNVEQYKDAISYLITTRAGADRVKRLRKVAISIGDGILEKSQQMEILAQQSLKNRTVKALEDISNSRIILIVTLLLSFFIALTIAVSMTRRITAPIHELLDATRRIKAGDLGYETEYRAEGEFQELLDAFNDMSASLKGQNQKITHHLHNLSNLYSIMLGFHSVSGRDEIIRELTQGVSGLMHASQCGVMLASDDVFRVSGPAVGMPAEVAGSFSVHREIVLPHYHASKRKALIMNENVEYSPTSEIEKRLKPENLMLVWIKHKGDVIGAIRVAGRREGPFTEEDARLLAILASNFAVALENTGLYENLKGQMQELQDAQEQLVQAVKLSAIGELASNVAHELNNPLSSILGYTELIKEEAEAAPFLNDLEVIEKESLRAREIVSQLLEFSRKTSLEIRPADINRTITEVIDLVSLNLRNSEVKIETFFGELPLIECDPNQLKQVFINLVNNAVFALEGKGVVSIETYVRGPHAFCIVKDNGKGMPHDVLPRIFEPFFSTKKEKGTGLGLSISYKIVQAHGGNLSAESEPGKGSVFTVILPLSKKNPVEGVKNSTLEDSRR